jgi:hypothetical protein
MLAIRRHYFVERAQEFDRRYSRHRDRIKVFWEVIREEYARYRMEDKDLPLSIEELALRAGFPPNIKSWTADLRTWRSQNQQRLNSDQMRLFRFAMSVYPPRNGGAAPVSSLPTINPKEQATKFHKVRGEIATFWDIEAWVVRPKHLRRNQADAREMLILVCWLEIALMEFIGASGPGKQRLFQKVIQVWGKKRWGPFAF